MLWLFGFSFPPRDTFCLLDSQSRLGSSKPHLLGSCFPWVGRCNANKPEDWNYFHFPQLRHVNNGCAYYIPSFPYFTVDVICFLIGQRLVVFLVFFLHVYPFDTADIFGHRIWCITVWKELPSRVSQIRHPRLANSSICFNIISVSRETHAASEGWIWYFTISAILTYWWAAGNQFLFTVQHYIQYSSLFLR